MDVKNVITLLTPYRASILTKPSSRSTGRAGLAHTDSEDCAEITVPCARNSTRRRGPVVEAILTPYQARPGSGAILPMEVVQGCQDALGRDFEDRSVVGISSSAGSGPVKVPITGFHKGTQRFLTSVASEWETKVEEAGVGSVRS